MPDFQIYDRVRALCKFNDDEATFTITDIYRSFNGDYTLAAGGLEFDSDDFDFELVRRDELSVVVDIQTDRE